MSIEAYNAVRNLVQKPVSNQKFSQRSNLSKDVSVTHPLNFRKLIASHKTTFHHVEACTSSLTLRRLDPSTTPQTPQHVHHSPTTRRELIS